MEEPGRLQSVESQRVGHDQPTNTFTFSLRYSFMVMTPNSLGGDWGGGNSNLLTTYCMLDPCQGLYVSHLI